MTAIRSTVNCLLALLAAMLGGCLAIPTPGPEPYAAEQLERIEPGVTDREDVRAVLGDPHATRAANQYWFYSHMRTVATVMVGSEFGSDTWPLGEANWLVVEFSADGKVVRVERHEGRADCTNDGLCLLAGFVKRGCFGAEDSRWWTRCKKLEISDAHLVVSAPLAQGTSARDYQPTSSECSVYFFLGTREREAPYMLEIDGVPGTAITRRAFDWMRIAQGSHRIVALAPEPDREVASLPLQCHGGERFYLQLTTRRKQFVAVSETAFRAASADLRMVLKK